MAPKGNSRSTGTPGITKLGEKRFLARYRGPDHKERSKLCPTVKVAKDWLASERAKMVVGEWVDPVLKRTTFGEFAMPWLDRRGKREDRTVELYAYLLKNHILPTFGSRSFERIRPSLVQEWHSRLFQLHPSTAAKAYRLLSQIMRAAVDDGYLAKNPCKVKGGGKEEPAERPTASIAEAEALALAMPERLRLIVHLALWCQLRRGELLGLRRGDVNPLHQTITIRETRVRLMSGEMVAKEPKTDAGARTLVIPPHVFPLVDEHLRRFVHDEIDAYLFGSESGEPLVPRVLEAAWRRSRATIDRTDLHLHDLRHSGLTLAAITGATPKELMQRAGHADERAAMRYQHVAQNRDSILASALSALVPKAEVIPISRAKKVKNL